MYISLEIPEYWSVNHEDEKEGKYFISPNCNLKIFVHPCFLYVEDLLEIAKKEKIKSTLESMHNTTKTLFYDMLNRDFEIDLSEMVIEMRENKSLTKVLKFAKMNDAFYEKEEKNYDNSCYYLNENFKSDEEWNKELSAFRQKMIEKSND